MNIKEKLKRKEKNDPVYMLEKLLSSLDSWTPDNDLMLNLLK